MRTNRRAVGRATRLLAVLVLSAGLAGCSSRGVGATVRGSACGYSTNAGLFGGPQDRRGCGQKSADPATSGPSVSLPSSGSAGAITRIDEHGAKAMYGPAAVFAGRWPEAAPSAPPSGPISVSTQGTPSTGSVTSSTDIVLRSPPDPLSPGGIGPGPVEADEVHSRCTADRNGVTGSASFVNGSLTTSTDATGDAATREPIPDYPPPNHTRSVPINNVGGHPTIVFNEQLWNADGSLTVNAYHMYLFGPVAVGEQIVGQVTCGTSRSRSSPKDTAAPTCGIPVVEPAEPGNLKPLVPAQAEIGVVDSGGLSAISPPEVRNGTVRIGREPGSAHEHLRFVPGQTGPLTVIGTRTDEGQPMRFSFVATDRAGNATEVKVEVTDIDGMATATATCD